MSLSNATASLPTPSEPASSPPSASSPPGAPSTPPHPPSTTAQQASPTPQPTSSSAVRPVQPSPTPTSTSPIQPNPQSSSTVPLPPSSAADSASTSSASSTASASASASASTTPAALPSTVPGTLTTTQSAVVAVPSISAPAPSDSGLPDASGQQQTGASSNASPTSLSNATRNGPSSGAVAGIVIAVIILVAGVLLWAIYLMRKRRRQAERDAFVEFAEMSYVEEPRHMGRFYDNETSPHSYTRAPASPSAVSLTQSPLMFGQSPFSRPPIADGGGLDRGSLYGGMGSVRSFNPYAPETRESVALGGRAGIGLPSREAYATDAAPPASANPYWMQSDPFGGDEVPMYGGAFASSNHDDAAVDLRRSMSGKSRGGHVSIPSLKSQHDDFAAHEHGPTKDDDSIVLGRPSGAFGRSDFAGH